MVPPAGWPPIQYISVGESTVLETALIRWRANIRSDGATRFSEVEGGLNQMTIARFERLVSASQLRIEALETVPIRALRPVHCRLTREFTTAVVRTTLVSKA